MKKTTSEKSFTGAFDKVTNYGEGFIKIIVSESHEAIDFTLMRYNGSSAKTKEELKNYAGKLFELFEKIEEKHPEFNRVLNNNDGSMFLEMVKNPKELIKDNVVLISIISKGKDVYINQVLNPTLAELKQITDFVKKHYS